MYRGHVYVPKDPQLCHNIVHAHHDSVMTGHPGQWKTLGLVSHNYWWLGISRYVASYVAGCDACNCCKSFLMQKVGKLTPNRIPTCVMVQPPFPFSAHLWLPLTPSASTLPLPPPLHSNSKAYLHNLCNYITPTPRLTVDKYWTCSDLVPMPRAAVYIPFLHLSYLPDPFSLTIMGNYSFLV